MQKLRLLEVVFLKVLEVSIYQYLVKARTSMSINK
jgi:predicted DNA-binding transcriptional regulator